MHLCNTVSRLAKHSSKVPPICGDIIHINFHNALHHIIENAKHTSLECGKCIVKAKRHSLVSLNPKWTSEVGLLLVLCRNLYLKISGTPIQEAIEWVPEKFLKKWIDEG